MCTIGGCGQLTTCSETVGHETFEENRLEVGPSQVDCGGVPCRSRTDDDLGREKIIKNGWGDQVEESEEKTYDFGMHLRAPLVFPGDWGHVVL